MASYNKFYGFTKDLIDGVHDFDAHTFKVFLTNQSPSQANTMKANLTEISAGSGYPAGGNTTTITTSTNGTGTAKVTGTDVTWVSTGTVGPFQYAVLYNDTPTTPNKPLIAWWDYGSSITLNNGESIIVDFDASQGIFTVA